MQKSTSANQIQRKEYLEWTYELTLGLVLAWSLIWLNRLRLKPLIFPTWQDSRLLKFLYWRRTISEPGTVLEQVVWSLTLAAVIFAALRLLSRIRAVKALVRSLGGALALLSFPLLYVFSTTVSYDIHLPSRFVIWLELLLVLFFAGCFYVLKPARSVPVAVFVIVVHFTFWGWATESYLNPVDLMRSNPAWTAGFWISVLFHFGFPVFGALASVLWVLTHDRHLDPRPD